LWEADTDVAVSKLSELASKRLSGRSGNEDLQPFPLHRQLGRSILAEAILNNEGRGGFRAFSAGSHPKGHFNRRWAAHQGPISWVRLASSEHRRSAD
jgi:hypothetical protein